VLGGLGMISATLDAGGAVLHLGQDHTLVFGELDGERTPRVGVDLFSVSKLTVRIPSNGAGAVR